MNLIYNVLFFLFFTFFLIQMWISHVLRMCACEKCNHKLYNICALTLCLLRFEPTSLARHAHPTRIYDLMRIDKMIIGFFFHFSCLVLFFKKK